MFSSLLKGYSQRMVFGTDYPRPMDYPVENLFQLVGYGEYLCPKEYIKNSWGYQIRDSLWARSSVR